MRRAVSKIDLMCLTRSEANRCEQFVSGLVSKTACICYVAEVRRHVTTECIRSITIPSVSLRYVVDRAQKRRSCYHLPFRWLSCHPETQKNPLRPSSPSKEAPKSKSRKIRIRLNQNYGRKITPVNLKPDLMFQCLTKLYP